MSTILSFVSQKRLLLKPFLKSVIIMPLPPEELSEFVEVAALVSKETWLQYLHPQNTIQDFRNLKSLAVPTLVILGEKDKAIPIEFQEHRVDTIPRAVRVVMHNEGHAVVIESPEKVLFEINSFLKNSCVE